MPDAERPPRVGPVAEGVPKPYTTPKGFVPPTMGEQFRYAYLNHPQYRYGEIGLGCERGVASESNVRAALHLEH
ncbi:hypothetical protein ACKKBG_A29405 [Auxenochlorella protothecoides x Auxenochlorella symbiontica]